MIAESQFKILMEKCYRRLVIIFIRNFGDKDYLVKKGDRVCQGIFLKYYRTHDDDGGESERGGGYGSTGR